MDQIVSHPESAKLRKGKWQQTVNSRQEAASSRQKHLEASWQIAGSSRLSLRLIRLWRKRADCSKQ